MDTTRSSGLERFFAALRMTSVRDDGGELVKVRRRPAEGRSVSVGRGWERWKAEVAGGMERGRELERGKRLQGFWGENQR